jgi:small subunit ribosomal protein S5
LRGRRRRRKFRRRRDTAAILEQWVPRTRLGKMIQEGRITSIEEVFTSGLIIREL